MNASTGHSGFSGVRKLAWTVRIFTRGVCTPLPQPMASVFDSSFKLTMAGVFMCWKLVNATNIGFKYFFPKSLLLNIYRKYSCYLYIFTSSRVSSRSELNNENLHPWLKLRGAEMKDLIFYLPYYFVTSKSAWKYPQNNHQSVTCVTKTKLQNNQKNISSPVNVTIW